MSAAELIEQVRRLAPEEKQAFWRRLWHEFGPELDDAASPLTPEQSAELERRVEAGWARPDAGVPWETVRDELLRRSTL